jgi:hypothetical protein
VTLRIGFDLDGVLADMESELVRQARALFGEAIARGSTERAADPPPPDLAQTPPQATPDQAAAEAAPDNVPPLLRLNLSPRQQRKLWEHVESIEDFWTTLQEFEPGSIARLAEVAVQRRWEIIFLTKRPETAGATAQVQSQRWLESKGFALPSLYVVQGSRGRIAAALGLDIVVDDRSENCLDVVVDSTARAILVWRDDESELPAAARRLGIGVVKSVAECLDALTEIESAKGARGMVNRVRRLLGLKESANA